MCPHLAVHDAHLAPHLPDLLLQLLGEVAERLGLVGEDGTGDVGELRAQLVVHLAAGYLHQFSDLRMKERHIELFLFISTSKGTIPVY